MRLALALIAAWLALAPAAASAGTGGARAAARIAAEIIAPGYRALDAEARAHAGAWAAYCAAPDAAGFTGLRSSFHRLADAWAAIEFVRSGPMAQDYRSERLYLWPERKNAVEKALNALLSARNPADLEPRAMKTASAAVQGIPALERLLFGPAGVADGGFRCQAGAAIARNAAAIAAEITAATAVPATSEAAKAALATDIVTAYSVIKDRKIEPVLGADRGSARSRLAEAWRSGRSLRAMEINLEVLAAVAAIALEAGPEDASLPYTASTALRIAQSLSGDLGAIAAGAARGDLVLLRDAVNAAEDRAIAEIPAALGVTIGFNSLDGD